MPQFIIGHILWWVPNYQGMALIKIGGAQNETTKIGLVFPVTIICFYKFTNFARYSFFKVLKFIKAFAWQKSINICRQTEPKPTLSTYFSSVKAKDFDFVLEINNDICEHLGLGECLLGQ